MFSLLKTFPHIAPISCSIQISNKYVFYFVLFCDFAFNLVSLCLKMRKVDLPLLITKNKACLLNQRVIVILRFESHSSSSSTLDHIQREIGICTNLYETDQKLVFSKKASSYIFILRVKGAFLLPSLPGFIAPSKNGVLNPPLPAWMQP